MRAIPAFATCAISLLIFGCGGNSNEAITTDESCLIDARIEGEWVAFSRKTSSYQKQSPQLRIRAVSTKVYECESMETRPGNGDCIETTKFRLTKLGPYNYVDVFEFQPAGQATRDVEKTGESRHPSLGGHLIVAVHIDDSRICFGSLDIGRIRALAKKGVTLPSHEDPSFGPFRFTAPTEELREFLSKYGPEIVTGQDIEWRRTERQPERRSASVVSTGQPRK
jgi:hypothetical protein